MWNVTQQTFTHNRQHRVLGLKHRPGFRLWMDVSISCLCRCVQEFTQTSFPPFTYKSCLIISCLQIMFWLQVLSKDLPRTLHSLSGVWPCQLHIPSCLIPHYKPQLRFSGCTWLVGSWHKQGTPHGAGSTWDTEADLGVWHEVHTCPSSAHRDTRLWHPPTLPEESHFSGRKQDEEEICIPRLMTNSHF